MQKIMASPLLSGIFFFLGLSLTLALMAGAVLIDICVLSDTMGEDSVVENIQSVLLGGTSALFIWNAVYHPAQRGFCLLVAGFFGSLLIRESDGLFDLIHHGFWVYPALLVAFSAIFAARHYAGTTYQALSAFCQTRTFVLMAVGMGVVLVFSRLMGMGILWQALMEEGYVRTVKNVVEEGTELAGYSFSFVSALIYSVKHAFGLSMQRDALSLQHINHH